MRVMVDQFLDFVSLERGLSPRTREAYASDLHRFAAHVGRKGIDSVNALRRDHVLAFLMDEKNAGLSATTLARRLVAVRVFLRYLQNEGLLAHNVTDAMDSPKLWKKLPEVLSQREVSGLLDVPDTARRLGLRDRAILETLYGCGLRVSELTGLKLADLHFDGGYIRCIGKGNKERVVPLGRQAAEQVQRYLAEVRPTLLPKDSMEQGVFISQRGKPIDRRTVWSLIRKHAKGAALGRDVSPHTLRHSFASHLLAHDAPLRVIQEMLGHADIATTQIYTHVDQKRLKQVHRSFHPRA